MEYLVSEFVSATLAPWAGKLVLALMIFYFGRWLAEWATRLARQLLRRATRDETLVSFVGSILHGLLLLAVAIAVLGQLGVDTTALIALVGAAGLAIGLALKDSLGNFAAGFMLIVFRPFKVGDTVEVAGATGTVKAVNMFNTTLSTFDNKAMFVPNGAVQNGTITNYSAYPTRRLDLSIGVDYADDLAKAKQLLAQLVEADERILRQPEPLIAVGALAQNSVDIELRVWVLSSDYMSVKFQLLEAIKQTFDGSGISVPYPQLAVHLNQAAA